MEQKEYDYAIASLWSLCFVVWYYWNISLIENLMVMQIWRWATRAWVGSKEFYAHWWTHTHARINLKEHTFDLNEFVKLLMDRKVQRRMRITTTTMMRWLESLLKLTIKKNKSQQKGLERHPNIWPSMSVPGF
jgi:hypothetical protein